MSIEPNRMHVSAIIAAAGLSSRMMAFKPLLPLGDSTVIRRCVHSFQNAGIEDIVVITGRNADLLEQHLAPFGVHCVINKDFAATDMFHSIKLGLQNISQDTNAVFFTPGDIPLFAPESLSSMLRCLWQTTHGVIIPSCDGVRGHPVLIKTSLIPTLLTYTGKDGLKGALSQPSIQMLILELEDRGLLLDADTPADYERLTSYENNRSMPADCDIP